MSRPSLYTQELADAICERIADGKSLRTLSSEDGMPAVSAIMRWVKENPQFQEQYARAKQEAIDVMGEDMLYIADTPQRGVKTKTNEKGEVETTEGDMIEHRRLQVDARKWLLSKLAPKKYGDRLELDGGLTMKKAAADMTDEELAAIAARFNDARAGSGSPA